MPSFNDLIASAKGFRGKGIGYSMVKRSWENAIVALAKVEKLPRFERAFFVFAWREARKNRDPDNIAAAKKLVLDGLVAAGVIPDDGWAHVAGWRDEFDVGKPGVLVTIEAA